MSWTIGPAVLLRAGRRPLIAGLLGGGLLFYFVYHVTRFRLDHFWPQLAPYGDALIVFVRSHQVFELGDYPARLAAGTMNQVFPYPPPAVTLFTALGMAGTAPFMAAWLLFMAVGLVISMRASLAGERDELRTAWLLVCALPLALADSPIAWDLRNANSNLICLGLTLGAFAVIGRRPALAGALIGLGISLKLQGILLPLWLLWRGSRAALISTVATVLLLWIAVPILIFGLDGAVQLYGGWREQLRIISDPWIYSFIAATGTGPPLVSLRRAAMTLTGQGPDAATTLALLGALWAIWIGALAWYIGRALGSGPVATPSRAALADWTVLLLAPLPFNPWLEPYHAVPILPGLILCMLLALDAKLEGRVRRTALFALVAFAALGLIGVPFLVRGIGILTGFVVLVVALGILRPRLASSPD